MNFIKLMNIRNIFIAAVMSVIVISCKNDEAENPPALSGKWHMETIEYFECPATSDNRVLSCGSTGKYATCHDYTFSGQFYSIKYLASAIEGEGQYTITGNKIKFPDGSNSFVEYEFTLTGSTLTFIKLSTSAASCKERFVYSKM